MICKLKNFYIKYTNFRICKANVDSELTRGKNVNKPQRINLPSAFKLEKDHTVSRLFTLLNKRKSMIFNLFNSFTLLPGTYADIGTFHLILSVVYKLLIWVIPIILIINVLAQLYPLYLFYKDTSLDLPPSGSSDPDPSSSEDPEDKKKKYLKWILIGVASTGGVLLSIYLLYKYGVLPWGKDDGSDGSNIGPASPAASTTSSPAASATSSGSASSIASFEGTVNNFHRSFSEGDLNSKVQLAEIRTRSFSEGDVNVVANDYVVSKATDNIVNSILAGDSVSDSASDYWGDSSSERDYSLLGRIDIPDIEVACNLYSQINEWRSSNASMTQGIPASFFTEPGQINSVVLEGQALERQLEQHLLAFGTTLENFYEFIET